MPEPTRLRASGQRRTVTRCLVCHEEGGRQVACPRCGDRTCLTCGLTEPRCASCGEGLELDLSHATRDARVPEVGLWGALRGLKAAVWGEVDDAARIWHSDQGQQMTYPVVLFLGALLVSLPLWVLLARWWGRG